MGTEIPDRAELPKEGLGELVPARTPRILLVGLPGDMPTRILKQIQASGKYALAEMTGKANIDLTGMLKRDVSFGIALTGETIKDQPITDSFREDYLNANKILLAKPNEHRQVVRVLREVHGANLFGINFADAGGYDVNFLLAEHGIPFISGSTGAPKERESALVKAVQEAAIPAVIDKNMSVPLVLVGAALQHLAKTFPNSLQGFSGWGIDSHQTGKKDTISGTLVKWAEPLKALGINFYTAEGDRTSPFLHGDHYLRMQSPDGTVKLDIQTQVSGRETYVSGTLDYALPFLIGHAREEVPQQVFKEAGGKGRVYSMIDVLKAIGEKT